MKISVVTTLPELYEPFVGSSLIRRAQESGICSIGIRSLFQTVKPKERIDAPLFGHGAGMLIKPEVVERSIEFAEAAEGKSFRIFFSPHGKKFTQRVARQIAQKAQQVGHILFFAGRYEGVDERAEREYADIVLSIGDYVLMGGDLPAMVVMEAFLRYVPGVVGREASVEHDSFTGPFVDHPHYTAPVVWHEKEVPPVLRSGDHKAVDLWRQQQATQRTIEQHFDWARSFNLSKQEKKQLLEAIPPHYVVLMHDKILLPTGQVGTSSVTSIDIHDIARSSRTYGIRHYFLVTPLVDQQRLVQTLLDFWKEGEGVTYNKHRHEAVSRVTVVPSLEQAINEISQRNGGSRPILITTSANTHFDNPEKQITYQDQGVVWSKKRPVIILLGTAKGLSQELFEQCDYHLLPIEGLEEFNHLSVRSAAAIILDRWLGLQPLASRIYEFV